MPPLHLAHGVGECRLLTLTANEDLPLLDLALDVAADVLAVAQMDELSRASYGLCVSYERSRRSSIIRNQATPPSRKAIFNPSNLSKMPFNTMPAKEIIVPKGWPSACTPGIWVQVIEAHATVRPTVCGDSATQRRGRFVHRPVFGRTQVSLEAIGREHGSFETQFLDSTP